MSHCLWAVPLLQTWSQRSNLDPTGACPCPGRAGLGRGAPARHRFSPAVPQNVLWTVLPNVSLSPLRAWEVSPASLPKLKPGQEGRAPPQLGGSWGLVCGCVFRILGSRAILGKPHPL